VPFTVTLTIPAKKIALSLFQQSYLLVRRKILPMRRVYAGWCQDRTVLRILIKTHRVMVGRWVSAEYLIPLRY